MWENRYRGSSNVWIMPKKGKFKSQTVNVDGIQKEKLRELNKCQNSNFTQN